MQKVNINSTSLARSTFFTMSDEVVEAEGFICPYCLVSFATSGKLQSHFVDMHSGQGQMDDEFVPNETEEVAEKTNHTSSRLGHYFKVVRQSRPKACDVCNEIIWHEALVCHSCQVTVHTDKCEAKIEKECEEAVYEPVESPNNEPGRGVPPPQTPKGILPLVRRQVAKSANTGSVPYVYPKKIIMGRDRYVNEEFDLDLTYITERIIAMSFPASGVESAYRNNLKDVAKMLKTKHQENYMIFNLSERSYDISRFNNQVLDFGWPDHLAPSLERLSSVCKSIKSWLDSDPLHVAVVHCKGGKGRTGCVIAAFMHYSEICHTAAAALDRFAMKRFYDNKLGGVTQPSQRKYVHYFADLLEGKFDLQSPPVILQHVLMHGIPNFDGKGGCRPFLKIYQNMKLVHTSGLYVCPVDRERVKISIYGGLKLQGEILLKCYHKKTHTGLDSIFRCQFHTAVIDSELRLVYSKNELDDSFKDKRFGDNVKVELIFESWGAATGSNATDNGVGGADDIRSSLLIGRRSSSTSPNGGSADLIQQLNEPLATRNSYASFQGGYDNGISLAEAEDDVPDLIVLSSPSSRDRSVSNDSFKMDPNEIERVTHPQSSQIYTVVSKPFKQDERSKPEDDNKLKPRPPLLKPHFSHGDVIDGPIRNHRDSKSPTHDKPAKSVSTSNVRQMPSRPPPPAKVLNRFSQASSPAPPPVSSKPAIGNPPLSRSTPSPKLPPGLVSQLSDDANYSEVPDDLSPSPESNNSPVHQVLVPKQIKQVFPAKDAEDRISLSPKHVKQKPKPPPAKKKPNVVSPLENKGVQYRVAQLGKAGPRKPSYAEIQPDLEIHIEPLPNRTSAVDNDMWVRVKFPTMPPVPQGDGSLGRKSSSSSNLTSTIGSDVYSNLADLSINPDELVESQRRDSQRRHSFSEGDSRLVVIKATAANRDSIIPVSGAIDEPEYKNVDYNPHEDDPANYAQYPTPKSAYENQRIVSDLMALNLAGMVGEYDPEGDYINQDPEGQFHTYSNHSELLEQMRAEHLPIDVSTAEETTKSPRHASSQRQRGGSGASFLKFIKANLIRPKQPTEIHSGKISEEERHKTLAPFQISGIEIGRVNRDYEAFFRSESAWGSTTSTPEPSSTTAESTVQSPLPGQQPNVPIAHNVDFLQDLKREQGRKDGGERSDRNRHAHNQPPVAERRGVGGANGKRPEKPDRPHKRPDKPEKPVKADRLDTKLDKPVAGDRRPRPEKPERPSHIPPMVPKKQRSREQLNEGGGDKVKSPPSPLPSRKPLRQKPMLPVGQNRLETTESMMSSSTHAPSPPPSRRPHPPLTKKPSAPTPTNVTPGLPSHSHPKLHATNSDALVSPRVRQRDNKVDHTPSRRKNAPPPKPTPYYIQQQQAAAAASSHTQTVETTVKTMMPYWYKPSISREEAIELVQGLTPGSFIVRDSSTVHGGYALTIKISEKQVRHRKKLSEEAVVSEDMLVTHFLIQPDPDGVKLQGWNEKAFKSLPEFISQHTVERMCLPCTLVLPQGGGGAHGPIRRKPTGMKHALQTGAACDLVYLGSVEVSGPGTDSQLAETVQQLKSLEISSMNIVTFKASREGITLTDNMNGVYIKRQYPVTYLTFCGLDPEDTRWDFPHLQHLGETITLTNKPCFGIVHIPQDTHGYSCMVFAEFDSSQPVGSIVNFIQKVMKEHRHASRHGVQK